MQELKIKSLEVSNCKNVGYSLMVLNGQCAHITGENGVGKSTAIKTLIEALTGAYPAKITKEGKEQGSFEMKMTSGGRFLWNFNNEGKNIINYYEPNNFKPVRREMLKHICKTYFPSQFDINKFLTTTEPARRLKMISELIDVDLSDVSSRYSAAFKERKAAKKVLGHLEAQEIENPEVKTFDFESFTKIEKGLVDKITTDISSKKTEITTEKTRLSNLYTTNKATNEETERKHKQAYNKELGLWLSREKGRKQSVSDFNETQEEIKYLNNEARRHFNDITAKVINTFLHNYFLHGEATEKILSFPRHLDLIPYESPKQPELEPLSAEQLPDPMPNKENLQGLEQDLENLETELTRAQEALNIKNLALGDLRAEKNTYDTNVLNYDNHVLEIDKNREIVRVHEAEVLAIQNEIRSIIKEAKMPDDFLIDLENKNDILFRTSPDTEYLPINTETLASSAIFIAAFKLQANYSTQFKVIHFDVSYLSYTNRQKVIIEAQKMGIQLITESAAQNESELELQYKIIEDLEM